MTYNDPELFNEICALREQGISKRDICHYVGISESSLYNWLEKGKHKRSKKYDFRKRFDKATAKAIIHHHTQYTKKCETPNDHLRMLQILYPEYYVPERRIKATIKKTEEISVEGAMLKVKDILEGMREKHKETKEG